MSESTRRTGSAATDRFRSVTKREARAAAKALVTVNRKRGKPTPKWVLTLANGRDSA